MDGYGSGDDDISGDEVAPRDFLSHQDSFGFPSSSSYQHPASSSLNRAGFDFGTLDINSNAQWPEMQGFRHLVETGGAEFTQATDPAAPPPPSSALRGRRTRAGRAGTSDLPGARSAVAGSGSAVPAGYYTAPHGAYPPVPPEYPYSPVPPCYPQFIAGYRPLPAGYRPIHPGYPQYAPAAPTPPVAQTSAPAGGGRRGARRRLVGVDLSRGSWETEHTKLLCELYVAHMSSNGQVSKAAWKDIEAKFFLKTGKRHDQDQFKYRIGKLKAIWHWINDNLRNGTGLGVRMSDGMIEADDDWWQAKAGGNREILALKDGLPPYMEDMDMMFSKTAADGSTSYAPGQRTPRQGSSSQGTTRPASSCEPTPLHPIFIDDEEEEAEEAAAADEEAAAYVGEDVRTPVSSGSKRSSSSRSVGTLRSTADSPSKKKFRSPAIRAVLRSLESLNGQFADSQSCLIKELQQKAKAREQSKQQREETKRAAEAEQRQQEELMQLARDCGATETDESWRGLYNMLHSPIAIQFFLGCKTAEGRLSFMRDQAAMRPPV